MAAQAKAGDQKGYVSGDGAVEKIPAAKRCVPVKLKAVPTTLVLDTQGRIAARVNGASSGSTLRGLVEDVLAGT